MEKKDFYDLFVTLSRSKLSPVNKELCLLCYEGLIDKFKGEKALITEILETATTTKYVYSNKCPDGTVNESPRMPSFQELLDIGFGILRRRRHEDNQEYISQRYRQDTPGKTTDDEGRLACDLVAYFGIEPEYVFKALDQKDIAVPGGYNDAIESFLAKGKPSDQKGQLRLRKREFIHGCFPDFIDNAPKLSIPRSAVMPSLGAILGYGNNKKKEVVRNK